MPSNQQQVIEQAKFTYSPLGKASEDQTKTIKNQVKKQVDALKSLKPKEIKPEEIKPIQYSDYGDYFHNGPAEIRNPPKKIDFNNLQYKFIGDSQPIKFIKFKGPLHIYNSIHNGNITLEDVEKDGKDLKSDLGRIKQGNPKIRSKEQSEVIDNVTNLYELREKVVQLFNIYHINMIRNIYKSKKAASGLKVLTPKQMLQRLPIALAQIKAGNNSESLLNEIRQIVYSLHQSKKIKMVYNNIIKLIKV